MPSTTTMSRKALRFSDYVDPDTWESYRASVQRGQLQAYNPAMPTIDNDPKEWYYLDPETNETQGPYPGESMQHWRSGMDEPFLTDEMMVCLDGEAAWKKVSTVSSFL